MKLYYIGLTWSSVLSAVNSALAICARRTSPILDTARYVAMRQRRLSSKDRNGVECNAVLAA